MSFIAQRKDYDHQMQNIFHHSLIKMIVLHHLDQLNIAWDTFISNDIFTIPPIQHGQEAPSSSHPSTSIPPPQPIHHPSSSDESATPSPSSSPSPEPIHSPSRDESSDQEHIEHGESNKPEEFGLGALTHTYQRGHRKVFAPHIVGGALPSSSTKLVHKGKEKVIEAEIKQQEEDLHETEHDFQLVDPNEHDDHENTTIFIMEKDALIGELQVNLQMAKYIISYYEQENRQFEVKNELMGIQLIKANREAEKAKALLDEEYEKYGEKLDEQVPRRRPRIRGLKRSLELKEQRAAELANELTLNEKFSKMVNEN